MAPKVAYFLWDYENIPISPSDVERVFINIIKEVEEKVGRYQVKCFQAYGDFGMNDAIVTKLDKLGIKVLHVKNRKSNAADEKIKVALLKIALQHKEEPGVLVLLSGDGGFHLHLDAFKTAAGWKIVVAHGKKEKSSRLLLDGADATVDLELIVKKETGQDLEDLQIDATCFKVTNLPKQVSTTKVINWLTQCLSNYKGEIKTFKKDSGEAIIEFKSLEDARSAYTHLLRKGVDVFGQIAQFEPILSHTTKDGTESVPAKAVATDLSPKLKSEPPPPPRKITFQCNYWPRCKKRDCKFYHPKKYCEFIKEGKQCPQGARECEDGHTFCANRFCECVGMKNNQLNHRYQDKIMKKNNAEETGKIIL